MSYRPITDFWFLARCKYKGGIKRYGGYLGGFPERARRLIGVSVNEAVLHVCGGMARNYPYVGGFCEHDKTMDLDPACSPDFLLDCRDDEWPGNSRSVHVITGILIDPPYSEQDAEKYSPGRDKYPNPNHLVKTAINTLTIGRKAGIIHYLIPACPKNAKFIACVGIVCGFNNRIRAFSVYERTA